MAVFWSCNGEGCETATEPVEPQVRGQTQPLPKGWVLRAADGWPEGNDQCGDSYPKVAYCPTCCPDLPLPGFSIKTIKALPPPNGEQLGALERLAIRLESASLLWLVYEVQRLRAGGA